MTTILPPWAMIFAAGKGTRMMPLTLDKPKPMLAVAGQPLLAHALDRVAEAGMAHAVVNAHHCPQVIADYLPTRTTPADVRLSLEADLLETGGGVKHALEAGILDTTEAFVAMNADILCTNPEGQNTLQHMAQLWQDLGDKVDVLLLLIPKGKAWGHESANGDYALADNGQLTRLSNPAAPYVYAGWQITRPQLYDDADLGERFSNLEIFDRAEKAGRLYGMEHQGGWYHFSTPEALARFEEEMPHHGA